MAGSAKDEGRHLKRKSPGEQARAFENVINFEVNHMANNSAATPLHQAAGRPLVDTPEAAFIYNPAVDPLSIDDVMNCGLSRSLAVVRLLMGDIGANGEFTHSAATITNSLWMLAGQLEQLHSAMMNYRKGERA